MGKTKGIENNIVEFVTKLEAKMAV